MIFFLNVFWFLALYSSYFFFNFVKIIQKFHRCVKNFRQIFFNWKNCPNEMRKWGIWPRSLWTYFNCEIPSIRCDKNPLCSQEKPTKIGSQHAVCALLQQRHGACLQLCLHYRTIGSRTICERFANHLGRLCVRGLRMATSRPLIVPLNVQKHFFSSSQINVHLPWKSLQSG